MKASDEAVFDRRRTLVELLPSADRPRISEALQRLLQAPSRVVDPEGDVLVGAECSIAAAYRHELTWEIESIGYLETGQDQSELVRIAVEWLQLLLKSNARYLMAADLHSVAVQADYEALQEKHRQVKRSELRYRELSEQLERRVKEQVRTIELAQRSLYQTEKLASVGRLAAGVAHEINNPIGFVRSNLNGAVDYLSSVEKFRNCLGAASDIDGARNEWRVLDLDCVIEDFRDLLGESLEGADRVAGIVKDLKVFSRVDQAESEASDLNEVLRSACKMIEPQLPAGIELVQRYEELPAFDCNPALMGEVFFNLVQNAVQAIDQRGCVTVVSGVHNDNIEVSVRDSGRGIPEKIRAKLFDPFFTTRAVGEGTGLGLTVANDVIRGLGGSIEVISREGEGSVFTMRWPLPRGVSPP